MSANCVNRGIQVSWNSQYDMYMIMPGSEYCTPQVDEDVNQFVESFQNCITFLDKIFAYAA